ncbi:MAG: amino acid permease [Armatimonadota bacterium]|nr:MAG: amino acid permease [Armatimonadota bacterium]
MTARSGEATVSAGPEMERPSPGAGKLQRRLGFTDCTFLVVGSMVGSGIFLTTGHIAGTLSAPWLILLAWLLGGVMALTGALTYAELGASLPRAGGHYAYLREAYGPLVGFLDGWLSFIASFPGSIAFVALGMVAYLPADWGGQSLFTAEVVGFEWTVHSKHLIAIGIILGLSLINALGVRPGSSTQNVLTALKIAALVGIAGFGISSGRGLWHNLTAGGLPSVGQVGLAGFGVALIGVSFAYLGWDASTYMAAEVRQPQRNLPRSLAVGTVMVVGLYFAFNLALLYGLPVAEMAGSDNVTRDAVSGLLGPQFTGLVAVAILICILGSLNATIMVGPRIYYAMARDRLFPRALGSVNRLTRVPVAAIGAQALWACVIVLSATLGRILAFTVLVIWLLSALTGAAVFVLRRRRPDLTRPYRTWGYPWVPALFCLSSLALATNHLLRIPADLLWLAGFLAAGLLVYARLRRTNGPHIAAG